MTGVQTCALPIFFRIRHLSTDNTKILFIPSNLFFGSTTTADATKESSEYLYKHTLSNLAFESKIVLPCSVSNGISYKTSGKFVFISNAGTNHFVLASPDPNSGLLSDVIIRF